MALVLTSDENAMLFRIVSNYQSSIGTSAALKPDQVAYLDYLLKTVPNFIPVSTGDNILVQQLLTKIAKLYRGEYV